MDLKSHNKSVKFKYGLKRKKIKINKIWCVNLDYLSKHK